MTYDEARDEYGKLDKTLRSRVLDRVSELTDRTAGPEAEAAFIRAINEAKQPFALGGIMDFSPFAGIYGL